MTPMNRRRFLLLGTSGVFLLVLLGASAYWLLCPGSPSSQAGCDRISQGMSLADVEVILGRPAGDYHVHDRPVVVNLLPAPAPGLLKKVWIGNDGGGRPPPRQERQGKARSLCVQVEPGREFS